MAIGDAGQYRQQVAEAVAPVAVFAERHPGQVVRPARDRAHVVIEHKPFKTNSLELLEVLGKVLWHPAAVDPHQQIESLVDAQRIHRELVAEYAFRQLPGKFSEQMHWQITV